MSQKEKQQKKKMLPITKTIKLDPFFRRFCLSLSRIGLPFLFGLLFDCMGTPLLKIGLALGGRVLACTFIFLGLPGGLALAIACFAKALITGEVPEIVGLRMMPTGADSGNSGSGDWEKYLNLSPDSEGQGQENSEAGAASRKRGRSTDPREDVGPSSVRGRLDSVNAPETSTSSGWSGSWIEKWLNPGDTSSAPGDGQQPQGEVDQPAEVMGPEAPDPMWLKNHIVKVFFQIKGR